MYYKFDETTVDDAENLDWEIHSFIQNMKKLILMQILEIMMISNLSSIRLIY